MKIEIHKGAMLSVFCILLVMLFVPVFSFAAPTDNANTAAPNDPVTTAPSGDALTPANQDLVNSTDEQIINSPRLTNDGIFGCRGQGARVQNVGTRIARRGTYVPVNDAAVTENTGFLVYKECILDGVARKIAENGTAEMTQQNVNAIATGRNGSPQFSENSWAELAAQNVIITINALDESNIGVMCPAFKTDVKNIVGRGFVASQNKPNQAFACSLPGSGASVWSQLAALREEKNNAYGAMLILRGQLARTQAANEYNQRERWVMNNGFYDTVDNPNDPLNARVITPGYIIAQSLSQVLGSGFRQLESATEIDQVVSNLFGGLTTQLISDTRGLVGLTQPAGGQPSYLNRMVRQTGRDVRQVAVNAAIGAINGMIELETLYRQAKETTANQLEIAINKLRAAENECWNLIIPEVKRAAGVGTQTCVTSIIDGSQSCTQATGNVTLRIATSTQFSDAVINARIKPLATQILAEIDVSNKAIIVLNGLAVSVSSSESQANQQQAIIRTDTMLTQDKRHSGTDLLSAQRQRDEVTGALTNLVRDTIKSWGDDADPQVGWCNTTNPAVIDRWLNAWKQ